MIEHRFHSLLSIVLLLLATFLLLGPDPALSQCLEGDCVNGRGTARFEDGRKYTGTWKDGRIHGQGTMDFADGSTYVGQWENDLPQGLGQLTYNSGDRFQGSFRKGLRHGFGTYQTGEETYRGLWTNDLPHGYGVITYADGSTFSGLFKNGVRHGHGIYRDRAGKRYLGRWERGTLQGKWTQLGDKEENTGPAQSGTNRPGYASVNRDKVILRSGPGTGYDRIMTLPRGYPLKVHRQEEEWLSVSDTKGNSGWVHNSLVGSEPTVIVTVAWANLRQGPGKEHPVKTVAKAGDIFTVSRQEGKWLEVQGKNDKVWISNRLVWPVRQPVAEERP